MIATSNPFPSAPPLLHDPQQFQDVFKLYG